MSGTSSGIRRRKVWAAFAPRREACAFLHHGIDRETTMKTLIHARAAAAVLTAIFLAACTTEPSTASDARAPISAKSITEASSPASEQAQIERDLATLRETVAPFHKYENAYAVHWTDKITACMSDPALGGMGFHYVNGGYVDAIVRPDQPELLVYEPQANGKLRFVAVEFMIPYAYRPRDAEAPVLFGRTFTRNDRFQLWGLHVWVGKQNPSGLFASWNPTVNCDNTDDLDVMPMAH